MAQSTKAPSSLPVAQPLLAGQTPKLSTTGRAQDAATAATASAAHPSPSLWWPLTHVAVPDWAPHLPFSLPWTGTPSHRALHMPSSLAELMAPFVPHATPAPAPAPAAAPEHAEQMAMELEDAMRLPEVSPLRLDVAQYADRYIASAEVPGVRASDISVTVARADSAALRPIDRVVRIGVVRRRAVNCNCEFESDCSPLCTRAPCTCDTTTSTRVTPTATPTVGDTKADTKADIKADTLKAPGNGSSKAADPKAKKDSAVCTGHCAVNRAHCSDCEKKGDVCSARAPVSHTVKGCCGHCDGAFGYAGPVYRRSERFFGRIERALALPPDADTTAMECVLRDGVLTLTVPRIASPHPQALPYARAAHRVRVPVRAANTIANTTAHGAAEASDLKAAAEIAVPPHHVAAHIEAAAHPLTKVQLRDTFSRAAHEAAAAAGALPLEPHTAAAHAHSGNLKPSVASDNSLLRHDRVMREAVAVANDPLRRRAVLSHHMSRFDPRSAWAYGCPSVAFRSVLSDAMELARDYDLISHHIHWPPIAGVYNPTLAHARLMHELTDAVRGINPHDPASPPTTPLPTPSPTVAAAASGAAVNGANSK